jgi:CHAT domain-containing protein
MDRTRILHLACHGRYDKTDARGPYIHLAGESPEEQALTVADILSLRLADLDLAFLSGCHTGRTLHLGGDEMEGVHHAFLQAGARSVVACLWDIEDKATRRLVGTFYDKLRQGSPKWAALRDAQLEAMAAHPHPYYWAAFKLIGGAD